MLLQVITCPNCKHKFEHNKLCAICPKCSHEFLTETGPMLMPTYMNKTSKLAKKLGITKKQLNDTNFVSKAEAKSMGIYHTGFRGSV